MTKDQKPRLLVVDDEDDFRTLIADALEAEGYAVTQARDGEEAVHLARQFSFDLALLDVRMPKMNGIEVLEILRKEAPTTDYIMLTGSQEIHIAVQSIKLGAKEFLSKVQPLEELLNRVRNVLRSHLAEVKIKELQSAFTSKLLYNLLTPLRTIKSSVEFIEQESMGKLTDQQRSILAGIDSAICTMDAILNDMIDLSMFESGRVEIDKFPTNLDEVVPIICSRYHLQADSKKITLTVDVTGNIPTVEVDPAKIEQVIGNLMDNALKYTAGGGLIRVNVSAKTLSEEGDQREYIAVSIADTGVGIPVEMIPLLFDKNQIFIDGKLPERKTTGLGLLLCRSIVEAHNGKIFAESEVGKGSKFTFLVPTFSI
jgi:signal transduction histidine kinase